MGSDFDGISPWRKSLDKAVTHGIDRFIEWFVRHWLLLANTSGFILAGLPFLSPILAASGYSLPSRVIFFLFGFVCHQMPSRSFFIFGQQMAVCERNIAIFVSIFLAGLLFALVRDRLKPLDWRLYLVLITPMAIDGFTQLFGWRESTWELRLFTGTLFGVATIWFVYPLVHRAMKEIEETLDQTSLQVGEDNAS